MAFEADCGGSTVLETVRVARTLGFPMPYRYQMVAGPKGPATTMTKEIEGFPVAGRFAKLGG